MRKHEEKDCHVGWRRHIFCVEELVRTYAQTCTRGRGYEIPDARNFGSMWGDAISGRRAQRDPAGECITEAVFKVYSNIKSLGLS